MAELPKIIIISMQQFQSELLAHFLHQEINLPCRIAPPSEFDPRTGEGEENPTLILWDCAGKTYDDLWGRLGLGIHSRSKNKMLALINVKKDDRIEAEAIRRGVRGLFFENIETSLLARGIEAIVHGQLWYSRECMVAFLTSGNRPDTQPTTTDAPLTRSENNILLKIASGLSSSQIADELFISTNTVKTHIRNIYKKINVANRFEAARWVARNI